MTNQPTRLCMHTTLALVAVILAGLALGAFSPSPMAGRAAQQAAKMLDRL
jgi:hypothetical protein